MPILPVGAANPVASAPPPSPQSPPFATLLAARAPAASASSPGTGSRPPAIAALVQVERAQARLEAVLAAARAGRTFTAAELIGLQAEAYRCAQTVDLASKLVEQGAQAVKQALNTQLG